jgi:prepilin-type processing-associated H-X9-DG protein
MKKFLSISISILLISSFGMGQVFFLSKPNLDNSDNTYPGLLSNGVTKIVAQGDSLLWFATGAGLSKTEDFGKSFVTYYPGTDSLPRGGISAISVLDSIVWVAGVFDSTIGQNRLQTGGGLSYSKDYGKNWVYVPQPIDSQDADYEIWAGDTVEFLPVTTPVQNTTWDISVTPDYVYIVSWAGGIRRSLDFGKTWERIPLPSDKSNVLECGYIPYEINPQDPPKGNHNHKGFSILAYGDTVWVGTAGGINLGIMEEDGCIRWVKYSAQNSGISGNWVVSLARQLHKGKETIWAVTLDAAGTGEYKAISKTSDGGLTWATTLEGERGYGFAFHDSAVYVCTERGLFKSVDGENWALYTPFEDKLRGEFIISENVYASLVDTREDKPYLWVGTGDGIAKTSNDGLAWEIFRSAFPVDTLGQPEIYAYPNPFSPTHHNILYGDGHVRVHYHLNEPAFVTLEVFDFAMERVYKGEKHFMNNPGDYNEIWNGKNGQGEHVANGTYFCKITKDKNDKEKSHWTKLIVIK